MANGTKCQAIANSDTITATSAPVSMLPLEVLPKGEEEVARGSAVEPAPVGTPAPAFPLVGVVITVAGGAAALELELAAAAAADDELAATPPSSELAKAHTCRIPSTTDGRLGVLKTSVWPVCVKLGALSDIASQG